MDEELDILLECRTGRKWRLVAALQAVQHQAATRRQGIAQQRHLRATQAVEDHVGTTAIGVFVDLHEQILLFGDDDLIGTQRQQVITLVSGFGRGDDLQAQGLAQLHERGAGTVAGVSDQRCLAGLGPRQVDVGEVSHQQRRVVHAGLDGRENIRIAGQCGAWQYDDLAIDGILVGAFGREAGHLVAHRQIFDALTHRQHDTRHLMAQPGRQLCLRRCHVLTPEHVVPADADRFDTDLHLARCGLGRCLLFALEHLGRAKLVKTNHAGHREPRQMNL
ncbi:hypothetical protein D3C80_1177250 [compost metagenome]